jgi:hypothetical protein
MEEVVSRERRNKPLSMLICRVGFTNHDDIRTLRENDVTNSSEPPRRVKRARRDQ